MVTIGDHKIRCLIDTGSETSIIQPNALGNLFPPRKLNRPLCYKTLNGINQVTYKIVTPIPREFNVSGTFSWKVINFNSKNYSAIIGQNFLIPLKAKIDVENRFINILGSNIPFGYYNPYNNQEICSLENSELKDLNLSHLNSEEHQLLTELLNRYSELFYKDGDQLSATHEIKHEIITTTDQPIYSKIYRYPQIHEVEIQNQIKNMLDQNIIRESNSPYNSPLWVVPKKIDNSGIQKWRIVIDYRKLNQNTINDKFPIPNMDGILDKLGKAQYFSSIDLAKGFHQILMHERDVEKTAFSTPFGHYEFIRMPFGLKNAPATFQRLMNSVLRQYINKICVVYLDDILIFSTSLSEHIANIKVVFERLKEAGLKIQIDKCSFLKKETEFLGHILTPKGVKPNPKKIDIIQKLKLPVTQKQIKSFLGITGFFRKFIKDYSKIAFPMIKYLRKNMRVNTSDPSYILAFEKLKEIITNPPILRYPNFNKRFKLITDASNYSIGAVLTQEGHPISFASRTLNDHERNYSTIEKELLAIVWGVKYYRPYIFGREFDLQTDHQPLKWLQAKNSGRDINPRLQRWLVQLGEYDAKIDYIPGKENKIADFLSRINCEKCEINTSDTENLGITLNEMFRIKNINAGQDQEQSEASLMVHTDHSQRENFSETTNSGNRNQSGDSETVHSQADNFNDHILILDTVVNRFKYQIILTETKEIEMKMIFNNKRLFIDIHDLDTGNVTNIIQRHINKGKIAIFSELNDHNFNKLQRILIDSYSGIERISFVKCSYFAKDIESEDELAKQISLFHKNEVGHAGIIPTYEGIKHKIYHPQLKTKIHEIINNCDICTGGKYDRNPIKSKFHVTETPTSVNEIVHVDTYVNSKHSFIIFIDKFSKHAVGFYLPDRNNQTIIGKINEFLAIKGPIKKFVFDNEFNSKNVRDFLTQEKIEFHATKPNSHTGNSDIERLNNTLTEKIRTLNLEEKLPIITQMTKAIKFYNNTVHSTIKCTPFDVVTGTIDHEVIRSRLENKKNYIIGKLNRNREFYTERRKTGFIRNYRSVRHKEEPKFIKRNLENIHLTNIKRPFKFTDLGSHNGDDGASNRSTRNTAD